MDVAGKVVVVTGASSGFGRLTALELASRGWRTFGAFRGTASGFDAASAELRDARPGPTPRSSRRSAST
jgi:NAD(P)-dependent dehydrogenase (short-subunit alcohol dehydrogenase family)